MLRTSRKVCLILLAGLLLGLADASMMGTGFFVQGQQACQPERQPPDTQDQGLGGELSNAEKTRAFEELISSSGVFTNADAYDFRVVGVTNAPGGFMLPVILKSMAGIESGWQQYALDDTDERLETLLNAANAPSCDYGVMQTNNGSDPALFTATPSLLSNTRGNIAAGADVLAGKWNEGSRTGGALPVVNDEDPEHLINWYYAFANYNGGATRTEWPNNPNCGLPGIQFQCRGFDFSSSRAIRNAPWNWYQLNPENFPYQERVLYNLEYPRFPQPPQWSIGFLGLQAITNPGDYGIRPDDSLFLNNDLTSRAPDLLLFEHRVSMVDISTPNPAIKIEYNLPLDGNVTLQIIESPTNETVVVTLLENQRRQAGWHTESFRLPKLNITSHAYRITAVSDSGAEGRYVQRLTGMTPHALYLPFVLGSGLPLPETVIPLRNRDFSQLLLGTSRPTYWDIQAIVPSENGVIRQPTSYYASLALRPPRLGFRAGPGVRVEATQRLQTREPGQYRIGFTIEINNFQPGTELFARLRPAEGGTGGGVTWDTCVLRRETFGQPDGFYDIGCNVRVTSTSTLLSFLATFASADRDTQFFIDNERFMRP